MIRALIIGIYINKSELPLMHELQFSVISFVCVCVRFDEASTSRQVCENVNDNTMGSHNSNATYGDYLKASRIKTRHHPHMSKKHDRSKRK